MEEEFKLKDILLATSAAPTYFKPILVSSVNQKQKYLLSDGGLSANNPLLNLLSKAQHIYPEADEYQVVSLGTGVFEKAMDCEQLLSAGVFEWGKCIASLFLEGQQSNTQDIVADFPKKILYSRWNPNLKEDEKDMDNTSEKNIKALLKSSEDLLEAREKDFETLIDALKDPKTPLNRKSFH